MSRQTPPPVQVELPMDARIGIVASRFNGPIVEELIRGCVQRLGELGMDQSRIELHRVPGAFELPLAAKLMAQTRRYQAVICLGCVIRGDTPHFDYVAGEAARGIMNVSIESSLPVIFGVLTTNTEQQAWDRAGGSHSHAGRNAADAAAQMIGLARTIRSA